MVVLVVVEELHVFTICGFPIINNSSTERRQMGDRLLSWYSK